MAADIQQAARYITGSGRFSLTQKPPRLLGSDMIQAELTEQQPAQAIEDKPRLGMTTPLTTRIGRLSVGLLKLLHRRIPSLLPHYSPRLSALTLGLVRIIEDVR